MSLKYFQYCSCDQNQGFQNQMSVKYFQYCSCNQNQGFQKPNVIKTIYSIVTIYLGRRSRPRINQETQYVLQLTTKYFETTLPVQNYWHFFTTVLTQEAPVSYIYLQLNKCISQKGNMILLSLSFYVTILSQCAVGNRHVLKLEETFVQSS